MRKYIIQRFIQLIPVLIGITFLSFAMMRMAGSDAITELYGDKGAVAQEVIDAKKAELGLDKPFVTQYFSWLGGMLTGDMGTSYVSGGEVFPTFVSKLPATLLLIGSVFSEHLTPYAPYLQDLSNAKAAPSAAHIFGTDRYGRDMLSRVIVGSRASIYGQLSVSGANGTSAG